MARAAAGDDGHFAVLLGSAVAAQVAVHIFYLIAVGIIDTFEHLVHIVFRRVDNFFIKMFLLDRFYSIKPNSSCRESK